MKLKDLLGKYTVEGVVDFDGAETDFQSHINGIVTKDVKKQVGKIEAEAMGNFISTLGIEATDLDGVNKWVKTMNDSTTDFKTSNVTLETKLTEALTKQTELQSEYTNFKQDTLISSLGVKEDEAEFLKYKFNKGVTDEVSFESLVDTYKKDNRITTNRQFQPNADNHGDSDPLEALKKLRE